MDEVKVDKELSARGQIRGAMSWHKPVVRNQWQHITVHIGMPAKTEYGTWVEDPGTPKVVAGTYRVRWPDGTVEDAEIAMYSYRAAYEDHGHNHTVKGEMPHILLRQHGAGAWVPVDKLDIELWLDD